MDPALQQLKDIHLPPIVSWWPPAPGWFGLLIIFTFLLGFIAYRFYQKYRKKFIARYALKKLNTLRLLTLDNPNNINIAAEVSTLLRRTALFYFTREEVAGLVGDDWLQFLNQSGNMKEFNEDIKPLLTDVPYRKNHVSHLIPLFAVAEKWLKRIQRSRNV